MMSFLEFIKAVFFGLLEGITEWLPISSTGHMILAQAFIHPNVSPQFWELFLVVIQLGAVVAVPVSFPYQLNPFSRRKSPQERKSTCTLWGKIILAMLPAAIIGLPLDHFLEPYLSTIPVICAALIGWGIAFLVADRKGRARTFRVESVADMTWRDALLIGLFQVCALIPGTSRSGATILGALAVGLSRVAGAEFSFFLAIPVMVGASGVKLLKYLLYGAGALSGTEWMYLLTGTVIAFAVSLLVIRFLTDFVKRHDFRPFGVYRIVLGIGMLIWFFVTL